jgi:hypothetical protein
MSNPLFKTEGSVWRTGKEAEREPDEEDEDWVDRSLPSSPLDRSFQNPFEGGPSKLRTEQSLPALPDEDDEDLDVKPDLKPGIEHDEDTKSTPLREIDPDSDEGGPEDERQCRICFSGREEEETLGRLISPCLCTGSVRVSASSSWQSRKTDQAVCSWYVHYPFLVAPLTASGLYQCLERYWG